MTSLTRQRTVHSHTVDASAEAAYALVADVTRWPVVFGPTVHVDLIERSETEERFRLWALVNGEVRSWTSHRTLDRDARRITFRQETSAAPIASMAGDWSFMTRPDGRTDVVLGHDFTVAGDNPAALAWVSAALDRNSEAELAALGHVAGIGRPVDEVMLAFADRVEVPAAPAAVYAFIDRADRWPERLGHVSRVELSEHEPGVQHLEMDTVTPDGGTHSTTSVRLCFPPDRIVYKQLVPPALLLGHSGAWEIAAGEDGGAVVTARHLAAIDPAAVTGVLGEGTTLVEARRYARSALGANSRSTLTHAGEAAVRPEP